MVEIEFPRCGQGTTTTIEITGGDCVFHCVINDRMIGDRLPPSGGSCVSSVVVAGHGRSMGRASSGGNVFKATQKRVFARPLQWLFEVPIDRLRALSGRAPICIRPRRAVGGRNSVCAYRRSVDVVHREMAHIFQRAAAIRWARWDDIAIRRPDSVHASRALQDCRAIAAPKATNRVDHR